MGIKGKCECRSYNAGEHWGGSDEEVVLDQAAYFPDTRRKTVCVDACLKELILDLWANGIRTIGACCGHNRRPAPDIILSRPEDMVAAAAIASKHISVPIQLFCWVEKGGEDDA